MTFNNITAGDPGNAAPVMQNFRHVNYGNNLIPVNSTGSGVNNTLDFGSSSFKWKDGYFAGNITAATATNTINGLVINSGALSSVTTLTMSGNLTVDTNTLFVDASANKVGIGTASPAVKFEVEGNDASTVDLYVQNIHASGTARIIALNNTTNTNVQMVSDDANSKVYWGTSTGSSKFLEINTSTGYLTYTAGNVGIGTASPYTLLDISGSINQGLVVRSTDAVSTIGLADNSTTLSSNLSTVGIGAETNDFYIFTGNTDRLHITSTGNVGIGTTDPDRPLDVLSTAGPQIRATYTDGSVYTDIETNSSGNTLFTNTGGIFSLNKSSSNTFLYLNADFNTNGATIGSVQWWAKDSLSNDDQYASISTELKSNASGSEEGILKFNVRTGGASANEVARCQDNAFGIIDGITAPSTVSGIAFIYVDTADGDLKVKFGDGTVKTIATDT